MVSGKSVEVFLGERVELAFRHSDYIGRAQVFTQDAVFSEGRAIFTAQGGNLLFPGIVVFNAFYQFFGDTDFSLEQDIGLVTGGLLLYDVLTLRNRNRL